MNKIEREGECVRERERNRMRSDRFQWQHRHRCPSQGEPVELWLPGSVSGSHTRHRELPAWNQAHTHSKIGFVLHIHICTNLQ